VADLESQKVFSGFVEDLERFLGVKRTPINLGELWLRTNPEKVDMPLEQYFAHAFEWGANPDQWTGFLRNFVAEYEAEVGNTPVLNPELRFKRSAVELNPPPPSHPLLRTVPNWEPKRLSPDNHTREAS